jgi:hypothetical protein
LLISAAANVWHFERKNAAIISTSVSCASKTLPQQHRALAHQKELTYLFLQFLHHIPYSLFLSNCSLVGKGKLRSPFFIRRDCHSFREKTNWTKKFWIFVECLAKVRATG